MNTQTSMGPNGYREIEWIQALQDVMNTEVMNNESLYWYCMHMAHLEPVGLENL